MIKTALYVLGAVFILVGLLGFFNNPILGLFAVNTLHNLIHLVSGILCFVFAGMGDSKARAFAKTFGAVYLLVAILGFVLPDLMSKLLAINMMDNVLHVLLAIVFLALGLMKPSTSSSPSAI